MYADTQLEFNVNNSSEKNGSYSLFGLTDSSVLAYNSSPPSTGTMERPGENKTHIYLVYSICGNTSALIALIGIIGNTLNILVLVGLTKRDRNSHTPVYHLLLAMGIADLLSLLFVFICFVTMFARWPPLLWQDLTDMNSNFEHIITKIWFLPANIGNLASNWCVVALTVFKSITVAFPLRITRWCTVFRVRLSIVLIFALSLLCNIPDWLTLTVTNYPNGRRRVEETHLYAKFSHYYTAYQVIEVFLPMTINSVLVAAIIYNLYKTRHDIRRLMADNNIVAAKEREHRRIGYMLVSIILLFITCNIPQMTYIILRDYTGYEQRLSNEQDSKLQVLSFVASIFVVTNQTANVFLYCFVNKHYRRGFLRTLQGCRSRCQPIRLVQGYRTTSSLGTSSSRTKSTLDEIHMKPKATLDEIHMKPKATLDEIDMKPKATLDEVDMKPKATLDEIDMKPKAFPPLLNVATEDEGKLLTCQREHNSSI